MRKYPADPFPQRTLQENQKQARNTVPQESRDLAPFAGRSALLGKGFQAMLDNYRKAAKNREGLDINKYIWQIVE